MPEISYQNLEGVGDTGMLGGTGIRQISIVFTCQEHTTAFRYILLIVKSYEFKVFYLSITGGYGGHT